MFARVESTPSAIPTRPKPIAVQPGRRRPRVSTHSPALIAINPTSAGTHTALARKGGSAITNASSPIATARRAIEDVFGALDDNDLATNLFRIAQEAVSNAVKHSGATSIQIELRKLEGQVVLSVADNGRGLKSNAGGGMGLRIMDYRAGIIGGKISFDTVPGKGTKVICSAPTS